MLKRIEEIKQEAIEKLKTIKDLNTLQQEIQVKFLGKKGKITEILKGMGSLSAEERPKIGQIANELRQFIESHIEQVKLKIQREEISKKLKEEGIDVTIPSSKKITGTRHPITLVLEEIEQIFMGLGFETVEGPEIEYDYYNFEALNIPKNHPARDTQDTFYVEDDIVLRTQTSNLQIRVMEKQNLPIKMIAPGRVYRSDALDSTHSPVFHQIEGLVVDKGITMGDLKGTLDIFAKKLYGNSIETRFRPHHFPFTEPSAEMDITCFECGGTGCSVCKGEGFIEILGAGMVHPKVLKNCGIDPEKYSGFAFGLGLDRIVMFKYKINDIRLLYDNDLRFLSQFR